jgi:hypothetical protein
LIDPESEIPDLKDKSWTLNRGCSGMRSLAPKEEAKVFFLREHAGGSESLGVSRQTGVGRWRHPTVTPYLGTHILV